jgi:NADPH:quinone reductase-like Zn-dependent oxidoreductase
LSDAAGEIVAVGAGVTRVKVGERVAGNFFQRWLSGPPTLDAHKSALGGDLPGMLAEHVCLDEAGVVKVPEFLSFEEAACLPCAAVTAWNALVTRGRLEAGQTVLTMGTGGVSLFALQFAKLLGARVIITSSSDEKLARAKTMGADEMINYRARPDWERAVKELTGGRGANHVVEIGGPGTLEKSIGAVAVGGHIALIGVLAGFEFRGNVFLLAAKNVTLSGIYVGSREHFEQMNAFVARHQVRPVVDHVFEFADAPAAYRRLESGAHFGKVVVRV